MKRENFIQQSTNIYTERALTFPLEFLLLGFLVCFICIEKFGFSDRIATFSGWNYYRMRSEFVFKKETVQKTRKERNTWQRKTIN